ncbi:Down syndrome cell adhesion molecule homolog isoform X5 [Ixodes scapularis]
MIAIEAASTFIAVASSSAQRGGPRVHSLGFPPDLTLGDETGAHCVVRKDGSGPLSILWRKDGVDLESNNRMTVTMLSTGSSTLTIRRIEPGDIGNYTCIASSVQGSSEITVPLTVLGEY